MQKITPFLWFDSQAEEAAQFYVSVFKDSKITRITRYPAATESVSGKPKGSVMTVEFSLCGQHFVALNGGPHFKFTPAISMSVACESQDEIDVLWEKLSSGGQMEECGWLKDKYGVSWQIVPAILGRLIEDPGQAERVMRALLQMRKIDVNILKAA